jgi:hypothetical protein
LDRYLTFSTSDDQTQIDSLSVYSLAETGLLPANFGPIGGISIFLGENNSGKSRFMREIMRDSGLTTIHLWSEYQQFHNVITDVATSIDATKALLDFTIDISAPGSVTINQGNNQQIINLLWNPTGRVSQLDRLTIDPTEPVAQVGEILTQLKLATQSIQQLVVAFATDVATNHLAKIESIAKEITRMSTIFTELKTGGILANGGFVRGTGFRFGFGYLSFSKYRWNSLYPTVSDIDVYLTNRANALAKVLDTIAALKHTIEARRNSIARAKSRTYIPTLRTARTLISQDGKRLNALNDIFLHTTQHDYRLKNEGVNIDTGFGLYHAIDRTRNARHEGRTSFKAFEKFLSDTFFNGKLVEVVAERVSDDRGGNILVAVEGIERDIHDLGDGIQAIIMLLYPLFIAQKNAWFFIEEPETHLHPGFQRLFIETIATNKILQAKQLTIFLTTHSNHILDFAIQDSHHVNIFTFRRRTGQHNKSTYQIQLTSPHDLNNLITLGVQNSSVFLANCSIWVEGITDRLYFRAYLQAYLSHLATAKNQTISLLEGLHYTFLEYAGANITHYNFALSEGPISTQTLDKIKGLSIANRVMLIADADAGKTTRHGQLTAQQHDGFVYRVLPVREVENLLSPALIVAGLSKLYRNLAFNIITLKQKDYARHYLASHLRSIYPTLPVSFSAPSGTLHSGVKRRFAEAIVPHITWNSISPAAQKITIELYDFIIRHNPRLGSN